RLQRRIRVGVGVVLVADDRPVVVLVPDLPVRRVRSCEREIRARVARGVERVAHRLRPVLVMSRDDYEAVLQEALRMLVRIDVRLVRDVVPVALEEAYEVVLRVERALRGVRE